MLPGQPAPPSIPLSSSLICAFFFPSTPFCKFLHSAQDAQSINKTLSPPLWSPCTRGHPGASKAFPLKLLHWWPPGMPVALGTGRTGQDGGEVVVVGLGSGDNSNSPIMLMCWGKPVKNWSATKGNAFHFQGSKALHPSTVQLKPHAVAH